MHHDAKDATCTEIGWEAYDKCMRCDYSTYKEIAAEGHKESDWIIDANATCSENGSKHIECTVCNTIIHTQVLPATGHSYSDAWMHDETYHWHNATCGHDVTSDKVKHIYDDEWNCTVCGYHDDSLHGTEIKAKTLTLDIEHGTIGGKVSNNTKTFSFINEIAIANGAKYTVSTDINGNNTIPTKTVSLEEGDNTFYILVTNGEDLALYTVTLRRRLIYTVTFDVTGGEKVQAQQVEEDSFATEPTTERVGYTFDKWDWNFDNAITDNTTVTANWNVITYNIVYDLNIPNDSVSQDVDNSMNATTYTVEDEINFASLTRKGYTFAGWTVEKISKGTIDTVTTTANWTVINYDIVYDFGDATSASKAKNNTANPATYTIEDEVAFATPSRDGYEFVSWDRSIAKGTIDVQTIVASWEIQTYTITYVLNGWTNASDNKASYTIEDQTFALLDGISGESLFCGWYLDEEYKNCIGTIDASTMKDYIVYAMPDCGATNGLAIQNGVVKSYSGTSTDVVIPSYYKGKTVTSIGDYAFMGCTGLTSTTIPDSVTSIGDRTFSGCTGLTSITIPDSVTSIGDRTFSGCTGLTSITIPDSVTSIGDYAFSGCTGLTSVTIGNGVTSIGGLAFSECTGLTSITIPDSVTSIGYYVFSGCSRLTSITFEDTSSWYRTYSENKSGGTLTDVSSATTNATYFTSTYRNYYWYKK